MERPKPQGNEKLRIALAAAMTFGAAALTPVETFAQTGGAQHLNDKEKIIPKTNKILYQFQIQSPSQMVKRGH